MSDKTLAYATYDQNLKLLQSFLKLAHEQYITDYHTDVYHDAVGICNLQPGDLMYVAFSSSGCGTFVQSYAASQHDPADFEEAQKKICKDLSVNAGVTIVYKLVGGAEKVEVLNSYVWRGF